MEIEKLPEKVRHVNIKKIRVPERRETERLASSEIVQRFHVPVSRY